MKPRALLMLALLPVLAAQLASASYTVTNLNVTVSLGRNTSAQVTEILTVLISNNSVAQYTTNRVALNLTLSDWQTLIGPLLVQHIINPRAGIENFKFLPGAVTTKPNGDHVAYILMGYTVNNVTTVNQTSPRTFVYRFSPTVFNFEHGASGEILNQNTTLTITLPSGAVIKTVYPLPDAPASAFTNNYQNTTTISWFYGEPLSKFALSFVMTEGIQAEVTNFFSTMYHTLGIFTYVLVVGVILAFIVYAYMRASG